jgi:hypothetical protein
MTKMTREEAMNKIKETIKSLMTFSETTEVKMTEVTGKDQTKFVTPAEKIEVGVEIYKLDDTGTQIPVEDGVYDLEDGTSITVGGGIVTEVSTTAEENTDVETEVLAEELSKESTTVEAAVTPDPLEERVTKLEDELTTIIDMLDKMVTSQKMTATKVEEFAALPGDKSIEVKNKEFSTTKTVSSKANMAEIDAIREILKKKSV